MDAFTAFFSELFEALGPHVLIVFGIALFIGIIAQWALYAKCNLPGIACIVPVWNVVVFLKIMGRPWWHMFYLFIPLYNIYFVAKVYIELCNCFGKKSTLDYVLIILLNGFYLLNLGLSYETKYLGPVYKTRAQKAAEAAEPQLA